jgi:hypothetical protein
MYRYRCLRPSEDRTKTALFINTQGLNLKLAYKIELASLLEDTLAITEGGDVSGSVLLVHSLAGELFSNHVSEDSHHSSSAVVQLNIELAGLLFGVGDLASEPTNSVVSVVLGGRQPGQLNKGNEEEDLGKSSGGDGGNTGHTSGDIGELQVVGWGQVSIEYVVVVVDDASNNGGHSNTSVLALNSTTTLEGLGFRFEPSKRIENTKGLGDSKLELTDLKGRGGLDGLGRGESGGGSGEEGGDSELHLDI